MKNSFSLFFVAVFLSVGCQATDGIGFRFGGSTSADDSAEAETGNDDSSLKDSVTVDTDTDVDEEDSVYPTLPEYDPENDICPPDMVLVKGGTYTVGAPAEENTDGKSRIPIGTVVVGDFCISEFAFPGYGHPWPIGGLTSGMTGDLDEVMVETGRQVATSSQFLVATATSFNHRWPNGATSWDDANCDPEQYVPGLIGDYPDCTSTYGVSSLLFFSFWTARDDQISEMILGSQNPSSADQSYVVFGGTPTVLNAFYGDDDWGYHAHPDDDPPEARFKDDNGILLVAEPESVTKKQDDRYREIIRYFSESDGDWTSLVGCGDDLEACSGSFRSHSNSF